MDVVAVVAAVLVGLAFLVAGGTKLAAGETWLGQAADLGVPRPVAAVVPYFEIALGALAVAQVARPVTAGAAALALIAFTLLIVVRIGQGKRPPCACFGRWSASPIGAGHVARNAVLIVLAGVAVLF